MSKIAPDVKKKDTSHRASEKEAAWRRWNLSGALKKDFDFRRCKWQGLDKVLK